MKQEWSKIMEMYSSIFEPWKGKNRNEGMESEDTWKLAEERHDPKSKLKAGKKRKQIQKLAATSMYKEKNREVKRSCRREEQNDR